jgi:hypothetical protein
MGLSRELALGALRLTLGRLSTSEEIDTTAELFVELVVNQSKVFEKIRWEEDSLLFDSRVVLSSVCLQLIQNMAFIP